MKTGLFLTTICSLSTTTSAWTPSASSSTAPSRRAFLEKAATIAPLVFVAGSPAFAEDEAPASADAAAPAVAAVTEEESPADSSSSSSTPSDENAFIARLKAQSEANKDKYKAMAESNDKLSKRQFNSQYDRPSYVGIYQKDKGTATMVLKAEFEQLLADGKVVQAYQSKVSKKTGEISDDYSRPIFVYAN